MQRANHRRIAFSLAAFLALPAVGRAELLAFREVSVFQQEPGAEDPSLWSVLDPFVSRSDYFARIERERHASYARQRAWATADKSAPDPRAARPALAVPARFGPLVGPAAPVATANSRADWHSVGTVANGRRPAVSPRAASDITRRRSIGPVIIDVRALRLAEAGTAARTRRAENVLWNATPPPARRRARYEPPRREEDRPVMADGRVVERPTAEPAAARPAGFDDLAAALDAAALEDRGETPRRAGAVAAATEVGVGAIDSDGGGAGAGLLPFDKRRQASRMRAARPASAAARMSPEVTLRSR